MPDRSVYILCNNHVTKMPIKSHYHMNSYALKKKNDLAVIPVTKCFITQE